MTIYFTADTHWSHRLMARLRGFGEDIAAHDRFLVDEWNSTVWPGDTVYHLGDFAWTLDAVREITPQLNGTIILIAGNHDKCWTRRGHERDRRKAREAVVIYLEAGISHVISDGQEKMYFEGGGMFTLSHLPAEGDHTENERYAERRPENKGKIICGHVHDEWRTFGRQVNVGVDVWDFRPVVAGEVFRVFNEELQ